MRTVALGVFLSTVMALAATGAFLLARALLQPDRWSDPGLGWLVVLGASVAIVAAAFALVWRFVQARERERYLRANRSPR